jgi:polyisoprenoid-binding protein YceI
MRNIFKLGILGMTFLGFAACNGGPGGEKAKTGDAQTAASATGESFTVNAATSSLEWTGSKPIGTHAGTIVVKEGNLNVKDGQVTGGSFMIDMTSIVVTDLKAGEGKEDLEAHLKGTNQKEPASADHFFNVTKFPTGKFEIVKVEPITGDAAHTHTITGNLTLKDITKAVTFKANLKVDGEHATATAPKFTIDRTLWGINYSSKTIDASLKDKFIHDEIAISIKLEAAKAGHDHSGHTH